MTVDMSMNEKHKKNNLDYHIEDIFWIEGKYKGIMKYRRYEYMTLEDFCIANEDEIMEYITKTSRSITTIFEDIINHK